MSSRAAASGPTDSAAPHGPHVPDQIRRWARIEKHIELALYGSVTLIAAILGLQLSRSISSRAELIGSIWAVAVGLALAHWFAVAIANRLMAPDPVPFGRFVGELWSAYPLLIAALVATSGAFVATWSDNTDVRGAARGADIALIAFCGAIALVAGSVHKLSWSRRIALTMFVVLFASAISLSKLFVGH